MATLTALWIAAAAFLWQTEVPNGIELGPVPDAFAQVDEARHEHHDRVLRLVALGSLAAQLSVLVLLVARPPRVRGAELARAAEYALVAAIALFAVRLPFGAVALWWQRRYGVAELGYAAWFVDRLGPLAARAGLLAVAAVLFVALARRLGRRWWVAAAPVVVLLGVGVSLAQPLLSPRLEPLRLPAVEREVERLAERQGLARPEVEVRRTRGRTRQLNAEAIGIGPTTRVILWESTLSLPVAQREFLVAHELAHVARLHFWKGLAWFALLVAPGLALLARLAPLERADAVPRAILVAFVVLLAVSPFTNAVSRRYEAEADWVALETARDPDAATALLEQLVVASVADPSPPAWWHVVFGTHPTPVRRAAMAEAWRLAYDSSRGSVSGRLLIP